MKTEAQISTPKTSESWFNSFEYEYRLLGSIGTLRLMHGIASSNVIKAPAENDKTFEAFIYKLCAQLYKDPIQFKNVVAQWAKGAHINAEKHQALTILGMVCVSDEGSESAPRTYRINDIFEDAMMFELEQTETAEEIKLAADLQRHEQNLDLYVSYYLRKIEDETTKGLSIVNALQDACRNIEFYVGHDDPLFRL